MGGIGMRWSKLAGCSTQVGPPSPQHKAHDTIVGPTFCSGVGSPVSVAKDHNAAPDGATTTVKHK